MREREPHPGLMVVCQTIAIGCFTRGKAFTICKTRSDSIESKHHQGSPQIQRIKNGNIAMTGWNS